MSMKGGAAEASSPLCKLLKYAKGALAIRRIFSLVDMITKPKFSNCPNVFKIGLFRYNSLKSIRA